jgi:predicted peptidase
MAGEQAGQTRKEMKHLLLLVALCQSLSLSARGQVAPGSLVPQIFERTITKTVGTRYLLYLPKGYENDSLTRWPLLLCLHGKGERGSDLNAVKRNGVSRYIEDGHEIPFIVVAPQCPGDEEWDPETLVALVDEMVARYRVDDDRLYLTGLSMGGWGVWKTATAYPTLFAALAPVCGRVDKYVGEKVCRLKDIPVWVFHGAKDDVVPFADSEFMVNELKKCNGKVRFTVYPDAGHDSWTGTYNNPDLYEWFLQQKRADRGAE